MDCGERKSFKLSEVRGIVLQVGVAASNAWIFGEKSDLLGKHSCPASPKGFTNFKGVLLRADTASIAQSETFDVEMSVDAIDED